MLGELQRRAAMTDLELCAPHAFVGTLRELTLEAALGFPESSSRRVVPIVSEALRYAYARPREAVRSGTVLEFFRLIPERIADAEIPRERRRNAEPCFDEQMLELGGVVRKGAVAKLTLQQAVVEPRSEKGCPPREPLPSSA